MVISQAIFCRCDNRRTVLIDVCTIGLFMIRFTPIRFTMYYSVPVGYTRQELVLEIYDEVSSKNLVESLKKMSGKLISFIISLLFFKDSSTKVRLKTINFVN